MKKLITLLTSITMAASFTACESESRTAKKKKSNTVSTKEEAVKNYYESFSSGNIDKIFCSAAPKEYLDYCVKETGLPEDRLFYRLGRIGTDNYFDECVSYHKEVLSGLDGLKIYDSWLDEQRDSVYFGFNESMHNAGIKSNIEKLYYIDTPSGIDVAYEDMSEEQRREEEERLQIPGIDIKDGYLYLLDGEWYYCPEWLDGFIEVGIEGYDALPEEIEYDDEDDYNYNDYDNEDYNDYDDYDKTNSYSNYESENLCADSSNWTSWSSEENGCASNLKVLSDGAALEITQVDNGFYEDNELRYYTYYNQLSYGGLFLEKDAVYRLEFDYEASEDLSLQLLVNQSHEPYSYYFWEDIDIPANSNKHYSTQFTMSATDDSGIAFNCNDPNAATPYTLTIKNLTLVRVS